VDNNGVGQDGSMGIHGDGMVGDVVVTEGVAAVSSMTSESLAMISLALEYLQASSFLSTSKFLLPISRQLWRLTIQIVWLLVVALDRADETPGVASTERPPW